MDAMSDRPFLFLDVDGVIACFGLQAEQAGLKRIETSEGFPVHLADNIDTHLVELHELFRIVWCTSWFGAANLLLGDIGVNIGPFPVLDWRDCKLDAIAHRMGSDERWAFVDDEIAFELRKSRVAPPAAALLVDVDPSSGLTGEHMSTLRTWSEHVQLKHDPGHAGGS